MTYIFDYLTHAKYRKVYNKWMDYDNTPNVYEGYSDVCGAIDESWSPNQIASKMWLIDEAHRYLRKQFCENAGSGHRNDARFQSVDVDTCEIVGSWFGMPLLDMLERDPRINIKQYHLWDIDPIARAVCRDYLRIFDMEDKVVLSGKDYFKHERKGSEAGLVINTSSEHMHETFNDLKQFRNPFFTKDPIIIVQSNNMFHVKDHVSCSKDAYRFRDRTMEYLNLLYCSSSPIMDLCEEKYDRYMAIGTPK